MHFCSKRYENIPFAHRQHKHEGHCRLIHGHNWTFVFSFTCNELDACGFVIDFGSLKWLREWLNEMFDHALVLNADDPLQSYLVETLGSKDLAKIHFVPNCGAEGLASYLYSLVDLRLRELTGNRVRLHCVEVLEDTKNGATYSGGGS